MTALMHACRWRDAGAGVIQSIVQGVERQSRSFSSISQRTRLSLNLVQRVVNHQDRTGRTALHHLLDAASDWAEHASGFKAVYMQSNKFDDDYLPDVRQSVRILLGVPG